MSTLREALAEIHAAQGSLTPRMVVETARDPGHVLHAQFEWDDAVAAEAHRLTQAAALIRRFRVTRYTDDGDPVSVRAWQHVPMPAADVPGVYLPTDEVITDPIALALVMRTMEREWRALRRRYGHMEQFVAMVQRDIEGGAAA